MALPQEHIKALEGLRVRLNSLLVSFENLQRNLAINDPLPSWPELQGGASAIGNTMSELADALNSQHELFSTMHVYPNSTFPAFDPQRQELLFSLIFKKLDQRGADWIKKSLQDSHEQNGAAEKGSLASDQMAELWDWAGPSSRDFVGQWLSEKVFEDAYTVAERKGGIENVVTGVKRDLNKVMDDDEFGDSEDEDDDDDKMEEDKKPDEPTGPMPNGFDPTASAIPLEDLLRFGSGGDMKPTGPNR